MLVGSQISEDDLTETSVDTLSCSLQHNLPHTLWQVDHLAAVFRDPSVPSSGVFFKLIRITLPPHRRENSDQHRIEPTANLRLIQTNHLTPCHESSMLWHSSDKNLRSASARRNQEIVHSLVLQGDLWLLSENVEACFVVGRQDRLSPNAGVRTLPRR